MNYCALKTVDCVNGPGVRVSLFVSGCTNRCKGCFQPETWDFDYGKPWTEEQMEFLLNELKRPCYDGLTILGGEPFELCNQAEVVKILRRVKQELPKLNLWMYTGFTYDKDLISGGCRYTKDTDEILGYIDVLVDGKFILERRDIRLTYKGSDNQRVIDMQSTREKGCVCLSKCN